MTGAKTIRFALAGRQNSGKTSLLCKLTGSSHKPVNFPGSSVERVESKVKFRDTEMIGIDLPGISSLSTLSRDEEITMEFLRKESNDAPGVICAVLDSGKLSIELHLLKQLATLGHPLVVALNKGDICEAQGLSLDVDGLRSRLGIPIVETNGMTGEGCEALLSAIEASHGDDPAALPDYDPVSLAAECCDQKGQAGRTTSDRVDDWLLHRMFGLPLLALFLYASFQLIFIGSEPFMVAIETIQEGLSGFVENAIPGGALQSFIIDGLINGVGSVLIFLPQIVLLIGLVALMEASGYMARAAFLLDRLLRNVGLNGKSFVPLITSFGCAVPGILGTRIIENERDRIATIVVAPLMSCSARLPVYVVLIGAFFPVAYAGTVLFGMYALGIVLAALVAWALRRTALKGGGSNFMLELPPYQRPQLKGIAIQVWTGVKTFIALAGTIIFGTAMVIWLLSYYPRPEHIHEKYEAERETISAMSLDEASMEEKIAEIDAEEESAYLENSILSDVGKTIQPVFAPAGFDWRTSVGILAAFPARELIVPTLGILYSLGEVDAGAHDVASLESDEAPDGLRAKLQNAVDSNGDKSFTPLIALALMVFFALCSQCAATLGAIRRETGSWKWPVFTFVYMTVFAWLGAVVIYQGGKLLGLG